LRNIDLPDSGEAIDLATVPRLPRTASKRIEVGVDEAKRVLNEDLRRYTPGNPKWIRSRDEVLEGEYQAVEYIAAFAESLYDVYASEYVQCNDSVPSREAALVRRVSPLVRKQAEIAWTAVLMSHALRFDLGRRERSGPLQPGEIKTDVGPMAQPELQELAKRLKVRQFVIKLPSPDTPRDPLLETGVREREELFRSRISAVLKSRHSYWRRKLMTPARGERVSKPAGSSKPDEEQSIARRKFLEPYLRGKDATINSLAGHAGVEQSSLSRWHRGQSRLSRGTVKSLAEYLKIASSEIPNGAGKLF
jgi:transcriptional regulator with XRE-family HTH domain